MPQTARRRAWNFGRLFTNEDVLHIHKVVGIASLVHLIYRMCLFVKHGPAHDIGMAGDWQTFTCIVLHAILPVSALVFRLPPKRAPHDHRIWPEFRMHSILFSLSQVVTLLHRWAMLRYPATPTGRWVNVVQIFVRLVLASIISSSFGATASNTLRGHRDGQQYYAVTSGLILAQYMHTASTLDGLGRRNFMVCIAVLAVLQITAFSMTLRRKTVLPEGIVAPMYSIVVGSFVLVVFMVVLHLQPGAAPGHMLLNIPLLGGMLAMTLRVRCGLGKYATWAIMAVLMYALYGDEPVTVSVPLPSVMQLWHPALQWIVVHAAMTAVWAALNVPLIAAHARAKRDRSKAAK